MRSPTCHSRRAAGTRRSTARPRRRSHRLPISRRHTSPMPTAIAERPGRSSISEASDAATMRSSPSRAARWDTADALMPSARRVPAWTGRARDLSNADGSFIERSKQVVPTHQGGVDRVRRGAAPDRPVRDVRPTPGRLASRGRRPLDRLACRPPAGPSWMPVRGRARGLTPADAEADVDAGPRRAECRQRYRRSTVIAAWNSSPTREGGASTASTRSRPSLGQVSMQGTAIAARATDDVTDQRRPR